MTDTVGCSTETRVGGLVGSNFGSIAGSHATGNVTGGAGSAAGGLVGIKRRLDRELQRQRQCHRRRRQHPWRPGRRQCREITNSFATGAVDRGPGIAGGLAGMNAGTISHSWASGAVSGDAGSMLGGLVGINVLGTISESFSTSNVTGTGDGVRRRADGASMSARSPDSFATGAVTGGDGSFVGGLVAYNIGVPGFASGHHLAVLRDRRGDRRRRQHRAADSSR